MHWGSSTFLGFNPLYLFVRASKHCILVVTRLANRRLDLGEPMGGLHGNIPCILRGYLPHSSIVAHYPNISIEMLRTLSRKLDRIA